MPDDKTIQAQKASKTLRRFGLGLGALGALSSVFGIYFLFIANETLSWSSVDGSVVKTSINTASSLQKGSGATSNFAIEYYVSIDYTYDVNGQPYVSSLYSLGEGENVGRRFRDRGDAEAEAASRFPTGTVVTVHYNPQNPAEAVLKTGWNWGTLTPLLLGLFLGGTGWLFYAVGKSAKVPSESKA